MSIRPSWKYPFDGFIYLFSSPSLWKMIFFGILLLLSLSLLTSITFFIWLFPLQIDLFSRSTSILRWLSILISLILTLFEISFVVLIISCLLLTIRLKRIYQIIWKDKFGSTRTTTNEQQIEISSFRSLICLILFRLFLFLLTFPLNLIPILGTILFLYLNSFYYSWSLHYPYFHSIGLTFQQGKDFVQRNEYSYRQFGVVALLLEMIPIVNFLSPMTNLIGSVLWAADIESSTITSEHPRSYLLAPNPSLIEQANQHYGTTKTTTNEKCSPPDYEQVIRNDHQLVSPSAPSQDEKS